MKCRNYWMPVAQTKDRYSRTLVREDSIYDCNLRSQPKRLAPSSRSRPPGVTASGNTCARARRFRSRSARAVAHGGVEAGVTEPLADGGEIDSGLEQRHRRAVADRVRVESRLHRDVSATSHNNALTACGRSKTESASGA